MRLLLLCLSFFLAAGTLRAEIMCGLTLEWLADTCPYIGIYTFKQAFGFSPDALKVEATLTESLRGAPPQAVSFMYPNPAGRWNPDKLKPEDGDKFLVFLRDARPGDVRPEQFISLTKSIRGGELSAALEPDFSVLSEAAAIEKVIKDRIAAKPVDPIQWRQYPDNRFRLAIPHGTPAFRAVYSGSACFLIVPDDLLAISKAHLPK